MVYCPVNASRAYGPRHVDQAITIPITSCMEPKKARFRSGTFCSDGLCSNRAGKDTTSRLPGRQFVRFFRFPKDPQMRKKWSGRLGRDAKFFTPTDESRICSDHFTDEDIDAASLQRFAQNPNSYIKLLPDAIPNTDRYTGRYIRHESPKTTTRRKSRTHTQNLHSQHTETEQHAESSVTRAESLPAINDDILTVLPISVTDHTQTVSTSSQTEISSLSRISVGCQADESYLPQLTRLSSITGGSVSGKDSVFCSEDYGSVSDAETEEDDSDLDYNPAEDGFCEAEQDDNDDDGDLGLDSDDFDYVVIGLVNLLSLFQRCFQCGGPSSVTGVSSRGFAISVHYKCDYNYQHTGVWHSSEYSNRRFHVNMLVPSSFSLCGAGYTLLTSIFQCLKCPHLGKTSYYKFLNDKLYPIIATKWELMRDIRINTLKEDTLGITLAGDGHFDSPGWCAKFCTYSAMDLDTNAIVDFSVVQKKMYGNDLEKEGCKELLHRLVSEGITIDTFVTDQNDKIGKMMRTADDFKSINHSFDVWHMAKNLKKKLVKAAKKVERLTVWIEPVVTHFWYACEWCDGDGSLLLEIFHSCLLHLANKHAWTEDPFAAQRKTSETTTKPYPVFKTYRKCGHENRLTGKHRKLKGMKWLDMKSEEFEVLFKIITDTRRSNAMKKCAAFIHTGSLEVYHNVRLKYLPKRTSYTLKRMIIMAMLVCIEVNVNLEKTGKPKVYSQYSKVRAAWVEKPRNSGKVYIFRHDECT